MRDHWRSRSVREINRERILTAHGTPEAQRRWLNELEQQLAREKTEGPEALTKGRFGRLHSLCENTEAETVTVSRDLLRASLEDWWNDKRELSHFNAIHDSAAMILNPEGPWAQEFKRENGRLRPEPRYKAALEALGLLTRKLPSRTDYSLKLFCTLVNHFEFEVARAMYSVAKDYHWEHTSSCGCEEPREEWCVVSLASRLRKARADFKKLPGIERAGYAEEIRALEDVPSGWALEEI